MRNPYLGVCAFDSRMLSILGTLRDVQCVPKTAVYMNASSKNKVDVLIAKGFIDESPVPFSNKRLCSITPRGRTLFELMTVLEAVWESDPRKEIGFNLVYTQDVSDDTVAETPTAPETVQDTLDVEDDREGDISEIGDHHVPAEGGDQ